MQKKTIYFLEWIAQESGFSEDQILENMKPENQRWDSNDCILIEEFYKNNIEDICRWVGKLFSWDKSFLKPGYHFWEKIYDKWYDLVEANKYNFEFSRYPIVNWKIVKPFEKIKIKSKKLKI